MGTLIKITVTTILEPVIPVFLLSECGQIFMLNLVFLNFLAFEFIAKSKRTCEKAYLDSVLLCCFPDLGLGPTSTRLKEALVLLSLSLSLSLI